MKKILCFLGIILLLFLAALPPILRIILPDKMEEEKEIVHENVVLNCSNESYIANTSYQDEKVMMIIFKQLYPTDSNTNNDQEDTTIIEDEEDTSLENEEDILEQEPTTIEELDQAFADLKNKSNVIYNSLEDGEVIEIDFTISNHETLNLTKFTNNLADQRAYYENLGLTCLVIR